MNYTEVFKGFHVKHILIILALTPQIAQASCESTIMAQFGEFKQQTINLYPETILLERTKVVIGTLDDTIDARMDENSNTAIFDPKLCNYPIEQQASIIAHELGHFVAYHIYGNKLTHQQDEDLANYYGAKILPQETLVAAIEYFQNKCNSGLQGYCWLYKSWQYGKTH